MIKNSFAKDQLQGLLNQPSNFSDNNFKHSIAREDSKKNSTKTSILDKQSLNSSQKTSSANFNQDLNNYKHKLKIVNKASKELLNLEVAVADSDEKRTYGLMNLAKLPENKAMIFIFAMPQKVSFWMKNTKISLDMIFINSDNKIVEIYENAKPFSLESIVSKFEVTKVLELNAGLVKKHNIAVGNRIVLK